MSDWTGGYAAQTRYVDTIQAHSLPILMDVNLLASGHSLPHRGGGYRYGELGCGAGFAMIAMAAANPHAQFEGYDFMPEHIVRGQRMIDDAGLQNVNITEASFEELAKATPPEPFDYLVLHGVWSWVSQENQQFLTTILGRWLKPGGVVYLGYSSAAGWLQIAPIRRLFKEAPRSSGEDGRYGPARAATSAFAQLKPDTLTAWFWGEYKDLSDDYIDHDFGSQSTSAEWHPDLCATLAEAKLDYACPASLIEQFPPLCFDDAALAFVAKGMEEGWGETARDLAFSRTFRTDLFARGAPKLRPQETWNLLKQMTIAPWQPNLAGEFKSGFDDAARPWPPEVLEGLRNSLGEEEQTVGDLIAKMQAPEKDALQLALVAVARAEARIIRPRAEAKLADDSVASLNAVIKRGVLAGEHYPGIACARIGGPMRLITDESQAVFEGKEADAATMEGLARLELPGF